MFGVLRAHKDKEERPVARVTEDPSASGVPQVLMVASAQKDLWATLVHKVPVAILDLLVHLVLREALASLESKDNWETLVCLDLKERLDLKENLVHQDHKVQ